MSSGAALLSRRVASRAASTEPLDQCEGTDARERTLGAMLRLLLLALGLRAGVAPEIAGIHVDDESCSGLVHDNITAQRISCAKFIHGLQNLTETAAAASLPRQLRVSVDAGTGWVCPQPQSSALCPHPGAPYCGCINITYQGVSRSVADHVIHFSDEVVLMDYDRSPQSVYSRALPYLTTADRSHGAKQVRVGVAISGCLASASPPCQPEYWATRNESELATLMSAAAPLLQRHPSFVGFSVFGPWGDQSKANPAPSDTQWPNGTGTWYINHSMIVDPNPATRNAWLSWAKTRKVGEVYIAPHAGPVALVSIPGIEGGPQGDADFCRFIAAGEKQVSTNQALPVCLSGCLALIHKSAMAAQGLRVQIFPGPSTDYEFIRNCSATP